MEWGKHPTTDKGQDFLVELLLTVPINIVELFCTSEYISDRLVSDSRKFGFADFLTIAAHRGSVEMIHLLIKKKYNFADLLKNNNQAKDIYFALCKHGTAACIQALNEAVVTVDVDKGNKHVRVPGAEFVCGANIQFKTDKNRKDALQLAVLSQNVSMVKYLLSTIYFRKDELIAYERRNLVAEMLVSCQVNSPNMVTIFQLLQQYIRDKGIMRKCLHTAAVYNNVLVLKYMINNRLAIDAITNPSSLANQDWGIYTYQTPLMGAITKQNVEAVEILCNVDNVDINSYANGITPFAKVYPATRTSIIGELYSWTTLEYGAFYSNGEIFKILIRTLLKQSKVNDLCSFQACLTANDMEKLQLIAEKGVQFHLLKTKSDVQSQNHQCVLICKYLIENYNDYIKIAFYLRYDIVNTIQCGKIPNDTITTDIYQQHSKRTTRFVNIDFSPNTVDRWKIGEQLGRGAFGRVVKGIDIEHKHDGKESESLLTEVALKFISINKIADSQQENQNKHKKYHIIELIMNEIDAIQKINHKNIIKLLAYNLNIDNSGTVLLVFEYAPYGELYQFLAINKYFNNSITKTYFEQILDALQVCHTMGIIHRDIKPQNILLDSEYQIKIADFGLSTYDNDIKNKNMVFVGTRGYMSPEIAAPMVDGYDDDDNVMYKQITSSCDIFSLAVIVWQMLNGIESMPFDEATMNDAKYVYICDKDYKMFWKCHYDCRIVQNNSLDSQDLLLRMFSYNPDNRITINQIRNHNWYTKIQGYNNSKSKNYFKQTMTSIRHQLAGKQTQNTQQLNNNQMTSMVSSYMPMQHSQTVFKFSQIRYVSFIENISANGSGLKLFVAFLMVINVLSVQAHLAVCRHIQLAVH